LDLKQEIQIQIQITTRGWQYRTKSKLMRVKPCNISSIVGLVKMCVWRFPELRCGTLFLWMLESLLEPKVNIIVSFQFAQFMTVMCFCAWFV
jgi:hypothetical protein